MRGGRGGVKMLISGWELKKHVMHIFVLISLVVIPVGTKSAYRSLGVKKLYPSRSLGVKFLKNIFR